MNDTGITQEQANWLHQVLGYVATGAAGLFGWMFKNTYKRFNGHSKRIAILENECVRNTDLERFKNEIVTVVNQNGARLDQTMVNTNERIDTLFTTLIKNK